MSKKISIFCDESYPAASDVYLTGTFSAGDGVPEKLRYIVEKLRTLHHVDELHGSRLGEASVKNILSEIALSLKGNYAVHVMCTSRTSNIGLYVSTFMTCETPSTRQAKTVDLKHTQALAFFLIDNTDLQGLYKIITAGSATKILAALIAAKSSVPSRFHSYFDRRISDGSIEHFVTWRHRNEAMINGIDFQCIQAMCAIPVKVGNETGCQINIFHDENDTVAKTYLKLSEDIQTGKDFGISHSLTFVPSHAYPEVQFIDLVLWLCQRSHAYNNPLLMRWLTNKFGRKIQIDDMSLTKLRDISRGGSKLNLKAPYRQVISRLK